MTIRPYGLVLEGRLELGLELELDGNRIVGVGTHRGLPEPFVVSPAFVNAHSHLEYRALQGAISGLSYWPWIREITRLKRLEKLEDVLIGVGIAAKENRATGVAAIGEHADRQFSVCDISDVGLTGVVFQELITFMEQAATAEKWAAVERSARESAVLVPTFLSPHAYWTVDRASLARIGASGAPFSMHVAETEFESQLTLSGAGPIAEFYAEHGFEPPSTGKRLVPSLADLVLVRPGAQFVHCCDVDAADIALMAGGGVKVAHCPRSNRALGCPAAPVRQMLDAGIEVGLGLDSPASSGPIDMFAEMRAAMEVGDGRLQAEEVWRMATSMGARSLPISMPNWEIAEGLSTPLIAIHVPDAQTAEDLILRGSPDRVEWISAS